MQANIVLTVSESKRLIAQGVAVLPCVKRALESGLLVISTGSTNAYVLEEILGEAIEKAAYLTGRTMPTVMKEKPNFPKRMKDVVLRNGEIVEELDRYSGAEQLQAGDVFIKGANALNYEGKIAGITIGGPGSGGTIGAVLGPIISRRATLVIPVGLEKLVAHDIFEIANTLAEGDELANRVPTLFPVSGTIVTEIEALELLFPGLRALHVASGGVLGAEGSVRLLLCGSDEIVKNALELLESIQGEPPILTTS